MPPMVYRANARSVFRLIPVRTRRHAPQAKSLLLHPNAAAGTRSTPASPLLPFGPISAAAPGHRLPAPAPAAAATAPAAPPSPADPSLLHVSLATLLGCCEMLGHAMEDRAPVAAQQDAALLGPLQVGAGLRDEVGGCCRWVRWGL